MMRQPIGVIEGFFGSEWSWKARQSMCEFMGDQGGDFYLYAPKRDQYLRKNWKQMHPAKTLEKLQSLALSCQSKNVRFGLGLSPFEIHKEWNQRSRQDLKDKIYHLEHNIEFQFLGILFDDMRGDPDLANLQTEILEYVRSVTRKKLWFCPTYYSDDSILDKVFGRRPENYLDVLGSALNEDIDVFWTGPKVVSPGITSGDLQSVGKVLRRKPILWDNYFANDGPKQCNFLKLKPLSGRDPALMSYVTGWGFNLMNQAYLSQILLKAAWGTLNGLEPNQAFVKALDVSVDNAFKSWVLEHAYELQTSGLDLINETLRTRLLSELSPFNHLFAKDILDWLQGKYRVGPECLTD